MYSERLLSNQVKTLRGDIPVRRECDTQAFYLVLFLPSWETGVLVKSFISSVFDNRNGALGMNDLFGWGTIKF